MRADADDAQQIVGRRTVRLALEGPQARCMRRTRWVGVGGERSGGDRGQCRLRDGAHGQHGGAALTFTLQRPAGVVQQPLAGAQLLLLRIEPVLHRRLRRVGLLQQFQQLGHLLAQVVADRADLQVLVRVDAHRLALRREQLAELITLHTQRLHLAAVRHPLRGHLPVHRQQLLAQRLLGLAVANPGAFHLATHTLQRLVALRSDLVTLLLCGLREVERGLAFLHGGGQLAFMLRGPAVLLGPAGAVHAVQVEPMHLAGAQRREHPSQQQPHHVDQQQIDPPDLTNDTHGTPPAPNNALLFVTTCDAPTIVKMITFFMKPA